MAEILVTGGTGTLGRQLVQQLSYQGFDVGILTTRRQLDLPSGAKIFFGDLAENTGVNRAVENARVIIHMASDPGDARRVDFEGTKNLLGCINTSGLRHLIYVSIAGVDQAAYAYYQIKMEVEKMLLASDIPCSVLRATQFHDFVLNKLIKPFDKMDGSPLRIPKGIRLQPIDVKDVAYKLQLMAMGPALRSTITIGGPEILTIDEMTRSYLGVLGRNDVIVSDEVKGELYDLFRSGININADWTGGRITWAQYLQQNLRNLQP